MKKILICIVILIFNSNLAYAQKPVDKIGIQRLKDQARKTYIKDTIKLNKHLKDNNLPRVIKTDSSIIEASRLNDFGVLEYKITNNVNAAKTISTNKLYSGGSLGLSLSGSGLILGEWDGGGVLTTHQEFNNTGTPRVVQMDSPSSTNFHATHVAGTIVAGGVVANAKGMAFNAMLNAYDWNNDFNEMIFESDTNGMLASNHSYGSAGGWFWNGSSWQWANTSSGPLGHTEDYNFGYYDAVAADWDNLSYLVPNYLIVKAAGNDVGDGPGNDPTHPNDGPYDTITTSSNAKNILTVGAVNDISNGYTQASDVVIASFSSRGPTDDGRIKPDLVANGVNVFSTWNTGNDIYSSISGTSMATPSVTGSIGLLQEHYKNLFGPSTYIDNYMMKALLIHTADEAGTSAGPDYTFGWGLMNTAKATQKISEATTNHLALKNIQLNNGTTETIKAIANGTEPVVTTLAWADPHATPIEVVTSILDNTTKRLINDVDINVKANTSTFFPWKLNVSDPSADATNNTKNEIDNIEKIEMLTPIAGTVVTLTINHAGTLKNNEGNTSSQWLGLVTSGLLSNDNIEQAINIGNSNYKTTNGFYTTEIGTSNGSNTTCADTNPKNNVWFKFTALSQNHSLFILTGGVYGTLQQPKLALWNSTGTTLIACHQDTTSSNKAFINVNNLTIGDQYLVSVDNVDSTQAGSFTLFSDFSALQTFPSTSAPLSGPGTIRYNATINKFEGWVGSQWVILGSHVNP